MRIVCLLGLLPMCLLSLQAQTSITYYALAIDQPTAALGGAISTRVTIENSGSNAETVQIEFVTSDEVPWTLSTLGAMEPNCGPGCFAIELQSGESFTGDTPEEAPALDGYVRLTASADIVTSMEVRRESPECFAMVPSSTVATADYSFPVSWGLFSSSAYSQILLEETYVVATFIDDEGNIVGDPQGMRMEAGFSRPILSLISDESFFTGTLRLEGSRPFLAFVADVGFLDFCVSFPEQPAQVDPVSSVSFPTSINGPDLETSLLVGAGDTALSIEAIYNAQDGAEIEQRALDVPPGGAGSLVFSGSDEVQVGSLNVRITPPEAHAVLSEIISLGSAPPVGSPPAPLCESPEYLITQTADNRTAGAFSNPFSVPSVCTWDVLDSTGAVVGGGEFEVPADGQVQFFPDERAELPADFLGTFRAECSIAVHVFSLFQRISDNALSSNTAGCSEVQ